METSLIFQDGLDLPMFASFVLLDDPAGVAALRRYYEPYLAIARRSGVGIALDTATWRANRDWGARLGYGPEALAAVNRRAVELVDEVRHGTDSSTTPVVISGCIGPRGDGYRVTELMAPDEAKRYHANQIDTFSETNADMVDAVTMTYAAEAIGVVNAASEARIPMALSFTVESDGRLPSGQSLKDAIEQVDAETGGGAAYFMINCAHPTHFAHVFEEGGDWIDRIAGLRANASTKSHAELDESTELDPGDPEDLAARYIALRDSMPALHVIGGCCGTDARHIDAICSAWLSTVC